jgi:hypothetical protein
MAAQCGFAQSDIVYDCEGRYMDMQEVMRLWFALGLNLA